AARRSRWRRGPPAGRCSSPGRRCWWCGRRCTRRGRARRELRQGANRFSRIPLFRPSYYLAGRNMAVTQILGGAVGAMAFGAVMVFVSRRTDVVSLWLGCFLIGAAIELLAGGATGRLA